MKGWKPVQTHVKMGDKGSDGNGRGGQRMDLEEGHWRHEDGRKARKERCEGCHTTKPHGRRKVP